MSAGISQDDALLALAQAAGLEQVWKDVRGQDHKVEAAVLQSLLDSQGLPCGSAAQIQESLERLSQSSGHAHGHMVVADVDAPIVLNWQGPLRYRLILEDGTNYDGLAVKHGSDAVRLSPIAQLGYHQLQLGSIQMTVAVAPRHCPSVVDLMGKSSPRAWGVAAQLYSLRRSGPVRDADLYGAGDYTALAMLARHAAGQGASAVGISPVHAMFSADPQRYSPYSPSSRLFLNANYIDPAQVLGEEAVHVALGELAATDSGGGSDVLAGQPSSHDLALIAWNSVVPARMRVLRRLFDIFCQQDSSVLNRDFMAFRCKGGQALEDHGRYEALHAHFAPSLGVHSGWQQWPATLHDPAGAAVRSFAAEHEADVGFHVFLQWLADKGLAFAQGTARQAGMSIGLISDLAIGTDARGSHAWSRQGDILAGVSAGAPPDLYQPNGQSWGLTVFSPRSLEAQAYAPFLETLRASLAHAGGVRIDHVLGLARMWVIPQGAPAAQGAYLRYPLHDMLRLVALEAWRHKAMVVGENLGTVPAGFNEHLYDKGLLGTSVLWFERGKAPVSAPFTPPQQWSPHAMATSTTHDLPTIEGWWQGHDLSWRQELGQTGDEGLLPMQRERDADRHALWDALAQAGCVPTGMARVPDRTPRAEILAYVAKTPAPLMMAPLEDLLGLVEQPNLPGTTGTEPPFHPNWIQRLRLPVEDIFKDRDVQRCVDAIVRARSKP